MSHTESNSVQLFSEKAKLRPGGIDGNFEPWIAVVQALSGSLERYLNLCLSFLYTNKAYEATIVKAQEVIAAETTAGQVLTVEEQGLLVSDARRARAKEMREVASRTSAAWEFLRASITHESWNNIEAHPKFSAANAAAPKSVLVLWEIIRETHAGGGGAGTKITSAERQKIDNKFNEFSQGDLSLGDYHKLYQQWLAKRKAVGLNDISPTDTTAKFYAKLNQTTYAEMLRTRDNAERELRLADLPIPEESLAKAFEFVRGYQLAPSVKQAGRNALGVFAATADDVELEAAIGVIASRIPGRDTASVLLALKNSTIKGASMLKTGVQTGKLDTGTPMYVNGRPWLKTCNEPNCKGIHPYWLHTAITGKPLSEANQAKVDAFEKKKASSGGVSTVAMASVSGGAADSDDDEYGVKKYFVGMNNVSNDNVECNEYSVKKYFTAVLGTVQQHSTTDHIIDTGHPFDNNHLLYDNQAGISMMKTADHLVDIRKMAKPKCILGVTGGTLTAKYEGKFRDLGYIPIVPGATANILSQSDVRSCGYKVEYDNEHEKYVVHCPSGDLVFGLLPSCPKAHYACRIDDSSVEQHNTCVATVTGNKSQYSTSEIAKAEKARRLLINAGMPSGVRFAANLDHIDGTGITRYDIQRADDITGKHPLAKVRGGTKQRSPQAAVVEHQPRGPMKPASFEIDLAFFHNLAFLVLVLLPINYVMVVYLKNRTTAEVGEAIELAKAEAMAHNFDVQLIRCDGEKAVAAYASELNREHIVVDITAAGEKLGHVERVNQTLKEFVRGMENGGLPFRMCKILLIMCVLFIGSRLNILATKASPDGRCAFEHMTLRRVNAHDIRYGFGDYVEALKPHTDNSMNSRTEACICGIPTMNLTGGVQMLKLSTGKLVTRRSFTIRPMPDNVIAELNAMADEDALAGGDQWLGDDSLDSDANMEQDAGIDGDSRAAIDADTGVDIVGAMAPPPAELAAESGVNAPVLIGPLQVGEGVGVADGVADGGLPRPGDGVASEPPRPQLPAARRGRFGRVDPLQSVLQASIVDAGDKAAIRRELIRRRQWHDKEFCFKISVKAALRDRGEQAREAILGELKQMLDKGVWHGVHMRDLTPEQRRRVLRSSCFMKDKFTSMNIFEKFKARLVAGGDQQDHADYIAAGQDVSSPTASTSSVLAVAAIAAAEGRQVMTIDVGGAFLNTDIKATGILVHVRLDKVMTRFLLELAPEYKQFVGEDETCVVELDRALYGTLEAARLWYDNISAKLVNQGFVPNPYDPCVYNKTNKDGLQVTIVLYVDDLLVTCEDGRELDMVAQFMRDSFGGDITEHRGDVINYLAMTFDFRTKGEVRVTMKKLVDEIVAGCGVTNERATPATEELFNVRESELLGQKQKDFFRSYVAKLLYVAKRVKPEILVAVSFLSTRVLVCDVDDLAKLHRVLGYVLKTRDRGIVMRIGDSMSVGAYIDAAYGVHTSSGKSHSGCAIVLGGGGPVFVKSTKQKIVVKSSTEAELVALSDNTSQAIWVRNFVIAQGYDVGPVVIHQDNLSCMALMKRGSPASERSRHIGIRYFWVKERVDGKEAIVRYLSTDKMFANVMTKPVQGKQFINERDCLTNWY